MKAKRVIIVASIIITFILLYALYMFIVQNQQRSIEQLYQIKFTSTCKIMNYGHNGRIGAKVLIEYKDVPEMEKQLSDFFRGSYMPDYSPKGDLDFSWWDLNSKNIEKSYFKMVEGRELFAVFTRNIWAYICKDDYGQYYLYFIG